MMNHDQLPCLALEFQSSKLPGNVVGRFSEIPPFPIPCNILVKMFMYVNMSFVVFVLTDRSCHCAIYKSFQHLWIVLVCFNRLFYLTLSHIKHYRRALPAPKITDVFLCSTPYLRLTITAYFGDHPSPKNTVFVSHPRYNPPEPPQSSPLPQEATSNRVHAHT